MARNESQPGESSQRLIYPERPRLIVLEGIDFSGRTTQMQLLLDWLIAQRYHVTTTAWRTSPLISDLLARARTGPQLHPRTYSMLYAADHMDRTQRVMKPALERGEIVLADRYIYTAFARDAAGGLDSAWVQNLYRYAMQPDAVFYLHISPEEAVQRRLGLQQRKGQPSKSKKAAGEAKQRLRHDKHEKTAPTAVIQPAQLSKEALESFLNFEMRMYSEYQQMQKAFAFTVIEGSQPIDQVQATLRRAVMRLLLEI